VTQDDPAQTAETRELPESRTLSVWLVVASAVGLYAAASLVLDKLSYYEQVAAGKTPSLNCNINPIVGCSEVINTAQASIFWSIPNPLIGVVAWSAVGALAVVLLVQRRLPAWCWVGLQVGVLGGIVMVSWLEQQTIFEINALCPWCMVTWAMMIPTFWAVTTRNAFRWWPSRATHTLHQYAAIIAIVHYAVLALIIWTHFGSRLFS
jgi:uncharacterized membrane protein